MVKSRIGQFLKTSIKATPLGTPARRPFGSGGFTYSPAYTGYSFQLSTTSAMTLTARAASTSCLEQRPVAGRRRDWRHQYSVLLARRQTVTANGAAWLLGGFNVISGNAINAMDAPMRNSLAILTLNLAQ